MNAALSSAACTAYRDFGVRGTSAVFRNGLFAMDVEPTVFVVDDDPKMLRIVADVLTNEGIRAQTHASGRDFLASYSPDRRGCLLLDIQMPGLGGAELQQELMVREIELPTIFLTGAVDVPTTVELMKRGAVDLLTKPFDVVTLLASVRMAIAMDATAFDQKSKRDMIQKRVERLTPREHEVMGLVVSGHANKQIAYELKLSEKTVEIHRSRVMRKMEADSLAELVRLCLSEPIIRLGAFSGDRR